MKKYFTFLALVLCLRAPAQVQVGSNEIATMNRAGRISKDDLEGLKKTTTVFTLPYKDYGQQQQFEEAIRSVWTITPFRIIKPDEMSQYMKDGYSVFSFGGFMTTRQGPAINPANMHLAYDLWQPELGKKGQVKQRYFARILIYPDNETFFTAMRNTGRRGEDFSARMLSFLYNDAVIYNWSAGLLKGYLKVVNDRLLQADERGPFTEEADKQALAGLTKDTLYVPDYVQVKFNMFTGAEKAAEEEADESLKEAYPFPVKLVTKARLDELLLDKSRPVKYLVYTKSSTDKYINVYDSRKGLLYARYVKLSYNFKNKDLAKLAKVID